jgi:hypothetical protein
LEKILRAPLDPTDGNLTRSQVTAAIGAINAQLRADEQQLRRKAKGDTLARLIKLIEEEMPKISKGKPYPDVALAEVQQAEHVEADPSDDSDAGVDCDKNVPVLGRGVAVRSRRA